MYREVNQMPRCATCGILVPTQEIRFAHHERRLIACSERCVGLYDSYRYPRYRAEIEAREAAGDVSIALGYAAG
ncbi:MAG: hypothetical protein JSU06_15840 [Actinobacteria bacterium]|nr:hypothetical protein [Actinomycetota bacterium]